MKFSFELAVNAKKRTLGPTILKLISGLSGRVIWNKLVWRVNSLQGKRGK